MKRDFMINCRKYCLQNACNLFDDASLLFQNRRWARSAFVSLSVTEECSKYLLMNDAIMWNDVFGRIEWNKFYKVITSHKEKLHLILKFEDMLYNAVRYKDSRKYWDYIKENSANIENKANASGKFREYCLYVDIIKNEKISSPFMITKKISKLILEAAKRHKYFIIWYEREVCTQSDVTPLKKEMFKYTTYNKIVRSRLF